MSLWIIISVLIGVRLLCAFLHKFFLFLPAVRPASTLLGGGAVRFGGAVIYVILRDVPRFFIQFIFVNEATFFFACLLGVCPRLFFSWGKYCIKYDSTIVDEGSNEEDILPFFAGLWWENQSCESKSPNRTATGASTLPACFSRGGGTILGIIHVTPTLRNKTTCFIILHFKITVWKYHCKYTYSLRSLRIFPFTLINYSLDL